MRSFPRFRFSLMLIAGSALLLLPRLSAATLTVRWSGGAIRVAAPELHFLSGKLLDRARSGLAIKLDFHLSLWVGGRDSLRRRAFERFVVSYDLWEEKFSVTGARSTRLSASHLSAEAAEAWCLEHIEIPKVDLRPNERIWVRLEIREAGVREEAPLVGDAGLDLSNLIERLSRKGEPRREQWSAEAGPLDPDALKQ